MFLWYGCTDLSIRFHRTEHTHKRIHHIISKIRAVFQLAKPNDLLIHFIGMKHVFRANTTPKPKPISNVSLGKVENIDSHSRYECVCVSVKQCGQYNERANELSLHSNEKWDQFYRLKHRPWVNGILLLKWLHAQHMLMLS